ncbi:CapA family protein, partial [Pelagibacteraceae bacterium]|nr:CapA family protein [Pelagibacteraceae bacterium]
DFFYSYNYIACDYKKIINELRDYDKVFVNYEGSFSGLEQRKKSVTLAMSDHSLTLPNNASLILCNNHITDFGFGGVKKTLDNLKSKNVDFVGLNKNLYDDSFYKSYLIKNKNIFVATLGWENEECIKAKIDTSGVKPFNSKSITELSNIISNLKSDFKILYIHAGYEWEKYPLPDHVGLAREAIDIGFDLVYFCHSHTIQEYEFYKDKLIHYGLGNFYFSSMRENFPKIADKGVCLTLEFNDNNLSYLYRIIEYDRIKKESILNNELLLEKKSLIFADLTEYSENYKIIRARKKNPRPILYYKKNFSNYLKFRSWKLIVDLLGILNLRSSIKFILGWDK